MKNEESHLSEVFTAATSVLNLDENFKPFGEGIGVERFQFPSGFENHLKIKPINTNKVIITARFQSSDDIFALLLATDALKRMNINNIEVFIPYLPYARQDRVMVKGEPLSLKVFTTLINSQNYSKVYLFDPHSEVSSALIDNCVEITNHPFVIDILADKDDYLIVSPDAGAYKKIFKLAQALEYKNNIVLSNKVRDVSNGNIKNITIDSDDLQGKDVYIIDDICSKGGTFIYLSKELKKVNCGNIYLIVSHYENTADIEKLKEAGIVTVYTTDSIHTIEGDDYIKQIKLKDIITKWNNYYGFLS